jgi:hypothetical protein
MARENEKKDMNGKERKNGHFGGLTVYKGKK